MTQQPQSQQPQQQLLTPDELEAFKKWQAAQNDGVMQKAKRLVLSPLFITILVIVLAFYAMTTWGQTAFYAVMSVFVGLAIYTVLSIKKEEE